MPHQATDGDTSAEAIELDRTARSGPREAAMQPCLACGRTFPLTPENHDGYGPVCPNCGCLV